MVKAYSHSRNFWRWEKEKSFQMWHRQNNPNSSPEWSLTRFEIKIKKKVQQFLSYFPHPEWTEVLKLINHKTEQIGEPLVHFRNILCESFWFFLHCLCSLPSFKVSKFRAAHPTACISRSTSETLEYFSGHWRTSVSVLHLTDICK